ncbi:MAG: flippase activity-associated protein Agl23 [Anaerolineales bacterium]
MAMKEAAQERTPSFSERLAAASVRVDWETIAFAGILLLTILTRFIDLETRVMSHDESLHTYFSWKLLDEGSFQHSPLMHGPFQFHLLALSYFLFGVSDATARFPAAFASILAVAMMFGFRRWLGKVGALVAALLMAVSPYMLYYGRYVRNEALVVIIALVTFYAVFRYFEDRRPKWLYILAAGLALHTATKETFFIYTAQLMLFLGLMLAWKFLRAHWDQPRMRTVFGIGLLLVLVGVLVGGAGIYLDSQAPAVMEAETVAPADPGADGGAGQIGLHPALITAIGMILVGGLLATAAVVWSFRTRLRTEFPAFDVLLVTTSFTLPQLAAFPVFILGKDPLAYEDPATLTATAIVVGILVLISVGAGLAWNWRTWLIAAGVFFGLFGLFYTTVLTHPFGFFTGLVGSLGYWLEQHGVNRGSQPLYYYTLIQIPFYEFLPAIGALIAAGFGIGSLRKRLAEDDTEEVGEEMAAEAAELEQPMEERIEEAPAPFPVLGFIGYWAVTATLAYTIAGERMPWLTVHITLPYILLSGWAIGRILERVDWQKFLRESGWAMVLLTLFGLLAVFQLMGYLLGPQLPFAGAQLDQLRVTSGFLISLGVTLASFIGVAVLARGWTWPAVGRIAGVTFLGILLVLTIRTSYRAAFVNYDEATEYLVYAHSATGVKTVLNQAEELSRRTTDGMNIDIAYDDDVSWPFSWYMRDFNNNHFYGANPSRELLNYPLVIAGDNNWDRVEPILGDRYYTFEYIRMWWPMQDYFDLDWERVRNAITSPEYRKAIWDIWFDRDYSAYGALVGKDYALESWSPADRMKFFIRKDIASLIWDYGVAPQSIEQGPALDPYADDTIELAAERIFTGSEVAGETIFQAPRGIAAGPGGDIYIADAGNHRVVKLDPEGNVLATWGSFGSEGQVGEQPQLNEPWGVAVAPDGSIYVADTWNHRVLQLSSEGTIQRVIGSFGEGQTLEAFWGPRDVAIDEAGRIFVADTGNKRIVIFNQEGQPLASIGSGGLDVGQLEEPVGLAIGPAGHLYVADTWNQRVQVFSEDSNGAWSSVLTWPVDGWFGQSLQNKPYIDVSPDGLVCLSDPEGYRILCFDEQGDFQLGWGDIGTGDAHFDIPVGVAFSRNHLWVVDHGNARIMRFTPVISEPDS